MKNEYKLILASASPRRRELMQLLDMPFEAESSSCEEIIPDGMRAEETAGYLSGLKAEDVFRRHAGEKVIVIGSDTTVILDGRIFGKPKSEEDAFRMLKELSGRYHEVRTGVTVLAEGIRHQFTSATRVKFYELGDEEIKRYIATGEPLDKAGAYGIQDHAALFVEKIEGDYYTVVGFPIAEVSRVLSQVITGAPADLGRKEAVK